MTRFCPTLWGDTPRPFSLPCVVACVVLLGAATGSKAAEGATKGEAKPVEKAVEQYLCVADRAAGFWYSEGSGWSPGALRTEAKYLVAKTRLGDMELGWKVNVFGSSFFPFGSCKQNDMAPMMVACGHSTPFSVFGTFHFNQRTNRFMRVYPALYLNGDDRPSADTPYIEVGTCSTLLPQ